MTSFDDDPESGGSQDGSSEDEQNDQNEQNEQDEPMDEGDEQDAEEDAEEDDEEGDGESDDERPSNEQDDASKGATSNPGERGNVPTSLGETPNLAPTSYPRPTVTLTSPSPQAATSEVGNGSILYTVRPEALTAPVYDCVPTIAAPHSTSINVVTATPDLRWVFTGGSDGYIRKFNWVDTANSKLMLTVAQRHPFVDSVTKAGVLSSYWENEEPNASDGQPLSPVYSLAVHSQSLWLLSGLESGGINLQSVRHDEGKRIHCLRKHTSAVSVLNLAQDERSFLSGSWDKLVLDWDLDTGQVKRTFDGSGGQISAIEMRPWSSLPVPETTGEPVQSNGTLESTNNSKQRPNGVLTNGTSDSNTNGGVGDSAQSAISPADSLFGGNDNDSLFGDNDDSNMGASNTGFGADDDDEFSKAIANGIQAPDNDDEGDINMIGAGTAHEPPSANGAPGTSQPDTSNPPDKAAEAAPLTNGLPHTEDMEASSSAMAGTEAATSAPPTSDTTFLAASIDGTIRIWDKRQSNPVAKILPRNTPPWCMGACWSPDGNFIYAGRRNGTVEEFSLHKGLRNSERTFKFPNGSGAVSAVRAMPNGRHLVCASFDILRLYDLSQQQIFKHSTVPFLIVPGHRTGVVSQLYLDPTCRFMISTAGNRGWEGTTTQVMLGYEVNI